jgi:hypothetical protein
MANIFEIFILFVYKKFTNRIVLAQLICERRAEGTSGRSGRLSLMKILSVVMKRKKGDQSYGKAFKKGHRGVSFDAGGMPYRGAFVRLRRGRRRRVGKDGRGTAGLLKARFSRGGFFDFLPCLLPIE